VIATALVLALAAQPGPLAVVKSADADVQKVLQADAPTVEKLAAKADLYVDFGELARRALGKEWGSLKKKQQEDFSATMKGLLRANYAQKAISDGRGGTPVEYGEEKIEGDEATVNSTVMVKADRFPVVYKLYRAGPKANWRIYDVVTDDVSLVATYADQFRQVMAKKGFEGLLGSLKAKREQLEKQGPTSAKASN
jgi:phospholipid transport system substrate-binding protein